MEFWLSLCAVIYLFIGLLFGAILFHAYQRMSDGEDLGTPESRLGAQLLQSAKKDPAVHFKMTFALFCGIFISVFIWPAVIVKYMLREGR